MNLAFTHACFRSVKLFTVTFPHLHTARDVLVPSHHNIIPYPISAWGQTAPAPDRRGDRRLRSKISRARRWIVIVPSDEWYNCRAFSWPPTGG